MILCFNVIACECKINGSKDTNVLLMKIVNAIRSGVSILFALLSWMVLKITHNVNAWFYSFALIDLIDVRFNPSINMRTEYDVS